jgi:hypothetical protein
MSTQTATQMLAGYQPSPEDSERCFYCAGRCSQQHRAADVVKSSFTALNTTTRSAFVCAGCVRFMSEDVTVTLPTGETRPDQQSRLYSWVHLDGQTIGATKAHREWLSTLCLMPPQPPFVICLSDSGQRHLAYMARVCYSQEQVTVSLEGELIQYRPEQLQARLQLMKQIAAATGKPALLDPITPQTAMRVIDYYGHDYICTAWCDVQAEPLTRLAAWLCPPKEDCQREYPERTEPATTGAVVSARGQAAFSWAD